MVAVPATLQRRKVHLAALALREISRQIGLVPTAFYRHFQDMDELGLEFGRSSCLAH